MAQASQPPAHKTAMTSAERVRLHRLRELGYALKPCPKEVTNEECLAWAEGVWKQQGELMDGLRP